MLLEFIKRSWRPYLAGQVGFSLILAALFTITSGGIGLGDVFALTTSILLVAVPVTLVCAMPLAFWTWTVQQQRFPNLSQMEVTLLGFIFGGLLHTIFLMPFGGWVALPQILLFTALCGGGYGASFAFLFSHWGGLKQTNGDTTLDANRDRDTVGPQ